MKNFIEANVGGKVITTDENVVVVKDNKGLEHLYGQLNNILAKVGDIVEVGQKIGTLGDAGKLHYEVRKDGH